MKIDVMGVLFDNVTMEQALDRAETLMEAKASAYCVTPNGEIVWEAMQDPAFRSILNEADLVLPDGASVVLGSRILERPLQEKVAGIAFAEALVQRMAARGGRLYLLGGRPGIAEKAAENLTAKYPGLVICGTADGYFRDEAAVVEQVRKAEPDVLFVCLGAPKQERFMAADRSDDRPGREPGWLCRRGEACASVDDPLQPGVAVPADEGALPAGTHDAPAQICARLQKAAAAGGKGRRGPWVS